MANEKNDIIKNNPDFQNIINLLSSKARSAVGIKGYPFVYYERLPGNGRLLGFKVKETNSHLILKCNSKRQDGNLHCSVSIESFQGIDGWRILKHLVRDIIPFFRGIEEYLDRVSIDYPFVISFYSKTRAIHVEEREDPKLNEFTGHSI